MDAKANVFLGIWTNWSQAQGGSVWAQTLTTTREQGNYLLTFTGAFISMVAVRLWVIVSLLIYRRYADADAQDTLHQQRQVILRNASTPDAGFVAFGRLIWAWRHERRVVWRVLPALLAAVLVGAGFAVAGAFSSKISVSSDMGDDVLLTGSACMLSGVEYMLDDAALQSRQLRRIVERVNDAASYANECYAADTSGNLACDGFTTKTLPTAVHNTSAGCPFFNGVCMSDSNNLLLDTGYIRSDAHFGVNTPKDQSFAVRHVSQCAPLKTERFKSNYVDGNTTYVRYDYRDPTYNGTEKYSDSGVITVEDNEHQYASPAKTRMRGNGGANYGLSVSIWNMQRGELWTAERSALSLHPDLYRTDGDLVIVSLSGNGVAFSNAAKDDWYRPNIPINYTNELFSTDSFYMPEEAASPLACLDQWQWCRSAEPGEGDCGPLGSWRDAMDGAFGLVGLDMAEVEQWDFPEAADEPGTRLLLARNTMDRLFIGGVAMVVDDRDNALESQSTLLMGVQLPMPDAQWQRDVLTWWNTMNAYWQKIYVETALGSTDPVFAEMDQPPRNEFEKKLCQSQKIRSAKYTNFSVFGLCFIYATGVVVTVVSFALESVFKTLHERRRYKEAKYLAWTNDGSLQLHRLAHEAIGRGRWANCTGEVPTTHPHDKLARLDITERAHPVLQKDAETTTTPTSPRAKDEEASPVDSNASSSSGASVASGYSDTSRSARGDGDSESDESGPGTGGSCSPAVRLSSDSICLGPRDRVGAAAAARQEPGISPQGAHRDSSS